MNYLVKACAVLGTLALLSACGEPTEYDESVKRTFMDACIEGAGGDDIANTVCGCAYDKLVEEVPFEEFKEIDRALLMTGHF
ncbi:MAG: hypothetical protein O2910_02870 [Proteobacteria bacterium]|nr:hypothetical protein [Pseudomonadota bacterium]